MGTLADSLFNTMLLWVRALVSGIWALFTSEKTTLLEFLGKNWLVLALGICVIGAVIDLLVWMLRWQPFRKEEPKPQSKAREAAHAAQTPEASEDPEEQPAIFIEEMPAPERPDTAERAAALPDERSYPGMRYRGNDAPARQDTHPFRPIRSETVSAESDAHAEYKQQLAEYERQKAQYEIDMAEYRRKKAAYDAEMARQAAAQQKPAEELPPPPAWEVRGRTPVAKPVSGEPSGQKLADRLAGWIDPEETDVSQVPVIRTGRRRGNRHE